MSPILFNYHLCFQIRSENIIAFALIQTFCNSDFFNFLNYVFCFCHEFPNTWYVFT